MINIEKIRKFLTDKYNQNSGEYFVPSITLNTGTITYTVYTEEFNLWITLLKKHSRESLIYYFLEMLRVKFPELEDKRIEFSKKPGIKFHPSIRDEFFDSYII